MPFELTTAGLTIENEDEIASGIRSDLWTNISDSLNLASESPMGQHIGIISERISLVGQLLDAVYKARTREGASGAALVAVALLTGTEKRTATATTVTCTVNIDDGFSQAAGTMVAHVEGDPTRRFVNRDLVENSTGSTDNFSAVFVAEQPGAVEVFAGELDVIAEEIVGWNSITNALDGVTGLDTDTDETLRDRSENELQTQGSTTADAIRSDILNNLKDNITNCTVLTNETAATDENGLPPGSFEVIARGLATDDAAGTALATQILASKCAGDRAFGDESKVIQDSQGKDHTIGYTWVTPRSVYVEVDLTINDDDYPADGDTQVKDAIAIVDANYDPGDDVIALKLRAACLAIPGVEDVPALRLGFDPSPVGTSNLTIGSREIGDLDSSRVLVTHV